MDNPALMNALFIELENNIADEAIARKGYYNLLTKFIGVLSEEEKSQVEEIIAEELKHSKLLTAMIQNRNHIMAED